MCPKSFWQLLQNPVSLPSHQHCTEAHYSAQKHQWIDKENVVVECGRFIREAHEMKGLLQADVAEKLGVSRSYYGHIESGNREINFTLAINICRVLNLDISDFMKMLK